MATEAEAWEMVRKLWDVYGHRSYRVCYGFSKCAYCNTQADGFHLMSYMFAWNLGYSDDSIHPNSYTECKHLHVECAIAVCMEKDGKTKPPP